MRTPDAPTKRICALSLSALLLMSAGCVTPKPTLNAASADLAWRAPFEQPWAANSTQAALSPRQEPSWPQAPPKANTSLSANITEVAYKLYSQHLTKIDGARCPCRPTCSRYAVLAARKHGLLIGMWMTLDRLMLSTDETRSSSLRSLPLRDFGQGQMYYDDPVEENDFFF